MMRWTLGMAAGLALLPAAAAAQRTDAEAVRATVHAFHAALAAGDSTTALGHLAPDVVIHESGRSETLDEYRSGHLRADVAFAAAVRREVTDEAVATWGDAALYTARSRATGRWRERDVDAQGVETVVLVRTPEGWRIRHVHWSSRS